MTKEVGKKYFTGTSGYHLPSVSLTFTYLPSRVGKRDTYHPTVIPLSHPRPAYTPHLVRIYKDS